MSIEDNIRVLNGEKTTKRSYSVDEAATILGVARQTIYKLINQGCFRAIKMDKYGYRIIKASFDNWLEND